MNIKERAERLIKKCNTDDPFAAADFLGIGILRENIGGPLGYYVGYCQHQIIIIERDAPQSLQKFICAHELGHARTTPDDNTQKMLMFTGNPFTANKTERRANEFALRFLLNDAFLRANPGCSTYDLARLRGIPQEFVYLLGV